MRPRRVYCQTSDHRACMHGTVAPVNQSEIALCRTRNALQRAYHVRELGQSGPWVVRRPMGVGAAPPRPADLTECRRPSLEAKQGRSALCPRVVLSFSSRSCQLQPICELQVRWRARQSWASTITWPSLCIRTAPSFHSHAMPYSTFARVRSADRPLICHLASARARRSAQMLKVKVTTPPRA